MQLVIAEKPSVAKSIAEVIGASESKDGYMEGNGYLVSWCVGHLVELAVVRQIKSSLNPQIKSGCFLKLKASYSD